MIADPISKSMTIVVIMFSLYLIREPMSIVGHVLFQESGILRT